MEICEICGYKYNWRFGVTERGIVTYRKGIRKKVCTSCMVDIPDHIPLSQQYVKYLNAKQKKIKGGK